MSRGLYKLMQCDILNDMNLKNSAVRTSTCMQIVSKMNLNAQEISFFYACNWGSLFLECS